MLQQWFAKLLDRVWHRGLMRSGLVTGLTLSLLLIGLAVAYREHGLGNFHRLKAKIATTDRPDLVVPRPGGREAILLQRTRAMGATSPEFISATVLPGRGMNVLQIAAYLPGRGEVNLMASPPLESAAKAMSGAGEDAGGQQSLAMGGAFELPWAGGIWGTPAQTSGHLSTVWRGHTINLPATGGEDTEASGGLLLARSADSADTTPLPDGGHAQGDFHTGDFAARWPSKTDVTVTLLLSSRSIEVTVSARNDGDAPEPIGIGWYPRFAVLDGNRGQIRLHIPGEMREEVRDRKTGVPSGALLPVAGTPYDFTMPGGARLGTMDLDDCYVALHQNLLDSGPVAELIDSVNGYGLRMTLLSPTIKAMRVVAPANGDYVGISPQFNYDDPFGREWNKDTDTGMVVLQPGQSTQWKVRLELFGLDAARSPM
jgi:galactose mutarotase-like enzyme